jgi:hypothetical protein
MEDAAMSPMAAQMEIDAEVQDRLPEPFLPLQLASAAAASCGLIAKGLAMRRGEGVHRYDIAPLALAYEAAILASLTPQEVQTLRRLLTRVETAALKLSGH